MAMLALLVVLAHAGWVMVEHLTLKISLCVGELVTSKTIALISTFTEFS